MAVPTNITDLSATAASNSPLGSESIGTSLDDYLRSHGGFIRQLYDQGIIWCGTGGGTADVITLSPSTALAAHKTGQGLAWVQSGANTTNVTVNPSSLGAKAVTKNGTTALVAGDIPAGALVVAIYDGTRYQLQNLVPATSFSDSVFRITDNGDATKKVAFEASSITTGTTRTVTVPDQDLTLVPKDNPTFTTGITTPKITFNSTSGIIGTTTNDNAAALSVGEYVESKIASGSAVSLVNATGKNLTSISLTAGDWDVEIIYQFTGNSATTVQAVGGTLSTTSNTLDTTNGQGGYHSYAGGTPFSTANPTVFTIPRQRVSIASTTTYYAVAYAQFATNTCSVYGMMNARRVR